MSQKTEASSLIAEGTKKVTVGDTLHGRGGLFEVMRFAASVLLVAGSTYALPYEFPELADNHYGLDLVAAGLSTFVVNLVGILLTHGRELPCIVIIGILIGGSGLCLTIGGLIQAMICLDPDCTDRSDVLTLVGSVILYIVICGGTFKEMCDSERGVQGICKYSAYCSGNAGNGSAQYEAFANVFNWICINTGGALLLISACMRYEDIVIFETLNLIESWSRVLLGASCVFLLVAALPYLNPTIRVALGLSPEHIPA